MSTSEASTPATTASGRGQRSRRGGQRAPRSTTSTSSPAATTTADGPAPPTPSGRGGRARGRGGASKTTSSSPSSSSSSSSAAAAAAAPGGRGGKSKSQSSRGRRADGTEKAFAFSVNASDFVPTGIDSVPASASSPSSSASSSSSTPKRRGQSDGETSKECLICLTTPTLWCVGKCNHKVLCAKCTMRSRCLYQDSSCPLCRMDLTEVVVVPSSDDRLFGDIDLSSLKRERSGNLHLATPEGEALAALLLHTFNCPLCASPSPNLPELKKHLSASHQMVYCDVCLRHRKLFVPEQSVYAAGKGLKNHMKNGDANDPEAPRGHLLCTFCSKAFYDMDEHYDHMTDAHEECQMCRIQGTPYQFYADYPALEGHFGAAHFLCREQRCLNDRYVVFATNNELTAHNVAFHIGNRKLSKREERAARQLQLNVSYASSSSMSSAEETRLREQQEMQAEQLRMMEMAEMERLRKLHNDEVVARMISLIGDDRYNHFKGSSKLFLQGSLSATDFYDMFVRTFGAEANALFEGVIDLLPFQFSARATALRAAKSRWESRFAQFPSLGSSSASSRPATSNLGYLSSVGSRQMSAPAPPTPTSALSAPAPSSSASGSFAAALTRNIAQTKAPPKTPKPPPSAAVARPKPPAAESFPALSSGATSASPAATWGPKSSPVTAGAPVPKKKKKTNKDQKAKPACGFTIVEPQAAAPPRSAIVTPPPGINFHDCFSQTTPMPVWPVQKPAAAPKKKKTSKRGETLLSFG